MARAAQHIFSFKSNEIPANLQTGIIVLKWPEETTRKSRTPNIAHLSIDTNGFYLICHDKFKNEIECFDMALIHDTRTGKEVSLPEGVECLDQIGFGTFDVRIEFKWLSIYYGNTFVPSNDLRIIHFCFKSPIIAREWAEQLFRYGHNPLLKNLSSLQCLEKIYSKIINSLVDFKKRIPIQNLIQFLCRNNRDMNKETKIRQALEYVQLSSHNIDVNEFTFERFFRFYMHLMDRREIEKLFESLGGKHRRYINCENLKEFLKQQNDPVEKDYYEQKSKDLIQKYTYHSEYFREKGMCDESFLRYLLSSDNLIVDPKIFDLYMDMNKPLAHYFIASSHNTYLTASQLTGRASIDMYRQVLLTGCRCIELDVVDSEKNDEPEIKHIHTPIKPVRFIEVIVAIREYAFKVTSYPLILSIENHCSPKVQAKMVKFFVDVFGENLLTKPLDTHPCEENYPLPSPNDLRYKILIKNKKLQPKSSSNEQTIQHIFVKPGTISTTSSSGQSSNDMNTDPTAITTIISAESSPNSDDLVRRFGKRISAPQKTPREGIIFEDEYFSDDDQLNSTELPMKIHQSKAIEALSDLVNYTVPVRFKTFALAEERNRSFEMSSFSEDRAQSLIRDHAKEFLLYNQRQLSRIYPRGTRFESSNYNPYIFWTIGCQMVALNYQTLDVPMQINLGLFSFNGACGYIEKPSALCQPRSSFDPRIQTNVENVVSYQIDIKILSGQFLCQDCEPTFVDIQMYGTYGQINKRYQYRIRSKKWNGFQAIYDDTDVQLGEFSIRFPKVILPEMAALRFSVTAEDGGLVGQSFIPVEHLRSGYRHIVLRNQINVPINSSSLFIFIQRNIYINAKDQEFSDRLFEPLIDQYSDTNNESNNNDSSNLLVRRHHASSANSFGENFQQQKQQQQQQHNSVSLLDESSSYSKHIIAGSELNDKKRLCKILSLNDIHPDEILKRDKIIQNKLRRISMEYQSNIQKEEIHFQECLNLQYSHHDRTNNLQIKHIEQCLLKLYSKKFDQQQELENKQLNEYYKKLEQEITNDYNRQINQIQNILKKDKSRVDEHARSQIKKDANEIAKTAADRNKILILKQMSEEKNMKISEMTSKMLEDLYEQIKDIIQINLQINLIQIEEEKVKEVEICSKKYFDGYNKIKIELQHQISGDYETSYDKFLSSRLTINASMKDIEVHTLNQ